VFQHDRHMAFLFLLATSFLNFLLHYIDDGKEWHSNDLVARRPRTHCTIT